MPTSLLVLLLLAPPDGAETLKALQGVWEGARFTEGNGKDGAKGEALVLTVKDKALVVRKANGSPVGEATLAIDPDGKGVDALGTSGGYRNKTYLGILKIEGDALTWTINGTAGKNKERPTGWTANAGGAVYLIVAARKK
jgi:uncharacterized protein (TIGR03067 family)